MAKRKITGGGPSPHVCYIKSTRNGAWLSELSEVERRQLLDTATRRIGSDPRRWPCLRHRIIASHVTRRRYKRLLLQARGTCRDPYYPNLQFGRIWPGRGCCVSGFRSTVSTPARLPCHTTAAGRRDCDTCQGWGPEKKENAS